MEGMCRMLQQDTHDDDVVATGWTTTVREFCTLAFKAAGMKLVWEGQDKGEKSCDSETGECVVEVDPRYYRPTEVEVLLGDAEKARDEPGWSRSTSLEALAEEMLEHDLGGAKERLTVQNSRR